MFIPRGQNITVALRPLRVQTVNIDYNQNTITPPTGRGLEIPGFFFRGHLSQSPGYCSAKQILVSNFHYTLSDCNIFCTLTGGRTMAGYNAPEAFLVLHKDKHIFSLAKSVKSNVASSCSNMLRHIL